MMPFNYSQPVYRGPSQGVPAESAYGYGRQPFHPLYRQLMGQQPGYAGGQYPYNQQQMPMYGGQPSQPPQMPQVFHGPSEGVPAEQAYVFQPRRPSYGQSPYRMLLGYS
jgi:hypothetical protein